MRLEIRLVEIESFHLVEPGEVAIEHDVLAADQVNAPFDAFHCTGGKPAEVLVGLSFLGMASYLPPPSIFRSFSTLNMPGTSVIMNSTGRMNSTIGNSILMPALPTAASARRRRRVRSASA